MKQKQVQLLVASVLAIMSILGCAVNKELLPIGGSRSDGTITLGFTHGAMRIPQVDMQQGLRTAQKSCAAWGYTGAEQFAQSTQQCAEFSRDIGCVRYSVAVQYQCTGAPSASR